MRFDRSDLIYRFRHTLFLFDGRRKAGRGWVGVGSGWGGVGLGVFFFFFYSAILVFLSCEVARQNEMLIFVLRSRSFKLFRIAKLQATSFLSCEIGIANYSDVVN